MRRRVLTSVLPLVGIAVLVLAVPLALLGVRQVRIDFDAKLHAQASDLAATLGERAESGRPAGVKWIAHLAPGRRVEARVEGRTIVAGPLVTGKAASARATGEHGTAVTIVASLREERRRELAVLGVIALLIGASMLVAVVLALVLAGQLTRPLAALVREADRLGQGEFDLDPPPLGLPEVDRVAAVLARSGRRIGELVDRQRQFARDAAHQLRTPLTAIGLRLEEIATADVPAGVRDDAESALAQVDRLAAVITVLLARAQGDGSRPRPVDLVELTGELARHWGPLADREHRQLVVEAAPLTGLANRDHLSQALSVLLENALRHGAGTIRLAAGPAGEAGGAGGAGESCADVLIAVSDDGSGVAAERVPTLFTRTPGDSAGSGDAGSGIGLFLARALIEADGGKLALASAVPPPFTVTIPGLPQASSPDRPG